MFKTNCRCWHHWAVILAGVLAWVFALGFFWATWVAGFFLGLLPEELFQHVVILVLLALSMRGMCTCCCNGGMCRQGNCGSCSVEGNVCKHADSCTCGDCAKCR